jgi:hypothetical protein
VLKKIKVNRAEYTCILDRANNELVDVHEDNFSELFDLLDSVLNVKLIINREKPLPDDLLAGATMLVIGCPRKSTLTQDEIETIVKYVREGGNLLAITDAGGDAANETNLSELTAVFGIEIEATTVRDTKNIGSAAAPIIEDINMAHPANKNVMRVVIGGGATLLASEPVVSLLGTSHTCVIEQFKPNENEGWKVMKVGEHYPIAAATQYGQGKVVVVGDADMFSNDVDYGINVLDNATFIKNIFTWFVSPVDVPSVIDWLVSRLTALETRVSELAGENAKLKQKLAKLESLQGEYPLVKEHSLDGLE